MICAERNPYLKGNNTMVRRTLAAVGLAFTAVLLFAGTAAAQYVEPAIIVSDPNPGVGDTTTVTGEGCDPGPITLTLTQGSQSVVVAQTTVGADGTFTTPITIPSSFTSGTATLSSACGSTSITIGGGAVSPATALPRTGSSSTGTLWRVAVALLVAGGVLVLSSRKRSARVTVDA
jgi:LPXTG-motif cell wall-anchored protein